MTDTGPVPGEGLPGNAGAEAVQQPHADLSAQPAGTPAAAAGSGHGWSTDAFLAPATPVFDYLDQPEGAEPPVAAEDDDLLLMPAPQGSWGDPQPVPPQPPIPQPAAPEQAQAPQHDAPTAAPQAVEPQAVEPEQAAAQAPATPEAVPPEPAAAQPESGNPQTAHAEPAQAEFAQAEAPHVDAVQAEAAHGEAQAGAVPGEAPAAEATAPQEPADADADSGRIEPGSLDLGHTGPGQPEAVEALSEPLTTDARQPVQGVEQTTAAPVADTGDQPAAEPAVVPGTPVQDAQAQAAPPAEPAPHPEPEENAATDAAAPAPRVPAPGSAAVQTAQNGQTTQNGQNGQGGPVRRPLHLGPPTPAALGSDSSGGVSVRSLADRGPTPPPVAPTPVRDSVPGDPTTGPEYLDVPVDETASIPAQQNGEAPVAGGPWGPTPVAATVTPDAPEQPQAAPATPEPQAEPQAQAEAGPEVQAEAQPEAQAEPEAAPQAEQPDAEPVVEPVAVPVDVAETPRGGPADEPGGLADLDREPVRVTIVPEPRAAEPQAATPAARAEAAAVQPEQAETPAEAPAPAAHAAPAEATPVDTREAADQGPSSQAVDQEPSPETPAEDTTPDADGEALHDAEAQPEGGSEGEAVASPAAAGYDDAVRDAVHKVIRERRDIRNGFRQDPIPHEVLLRVLEAAHTAPSVGHSQPWDFVVIRSDKTREKMHELAMRQRDAYAKSLPKARAKQFRELKIEAILDTPVNIVVTADPTRGGRHTLGRHTQPQMAPYSSALAVENLWLAARAEGLGVGWVSFFDEREMVRELGLPDHLEVVAYLCVGYVDEFPEDPELVQAGWSKRRPLAWVVHEEEYGNRALPGEDPHDLLDETLRGIRPLDAKALGEAWERQKRMTKPSGALGMLEIISAQLCGLSRQCPPPIPEPAAVAIFAGDHGVHAQGVTAWPQEVTGQMVENFLAGGAVCNAFANQVGAEVCVIDVGVATELPTTPGLLPRKVRHGTGDFTTGPAMTREDVLRAIEVGIETARDLVAAGNKALLTGEMGIANTTASAALISVYTGVDPAEVTGRGTGINDEMHARKVDVVRRALELHKPDPADPIGVLAAIGGLEHAAMVGLLLGGASLRTPVILDGVSAGAAALVARAVAPEALAACIAGHRSAEPGHMAALTKLGLRPLVDLDLRLGEGTGALLALPLVQSAARVMHEVATFDSAGVTEKG
ncbi:nicotinate-nucleotide--dimethylbenzimidazole phosphoribosyltransferase [Streptantibioticus parmotrematis]|uniref:nicotinate-nucleotide--dimethylbenzimidazole phosphoribosyltransferase n=1 Tax=Streptantibioticus parmotrematis TaxID=2873249 RepID=UPI0033ED4303